MGNCEVWRATTTPSQIRLHAPRTMTRCSLAWLCPLFNGVSPAAIIFQCTTHWLTHHKAKLHSYTTNHNTIMVTDFRFLVITVLLLLACSSSILPLVRGDVPPEECFCSDPAPCLAQGACSAAVGGQCSPGSQLCTEGIGHGQSHMMMMMVVVVNNGAAAYLYSPSSSLPRQLCVLQMLPHRSLRLAFPQYLPSVPPLWPSM